MTKKEERERARAIKARQKSEEFARIARGAEKTLSEIERNNDTRRKILDGAHMQTEALRNPEISALLQKRREEKLVYDDDRELFGLPPLSDEEKLAHGVPVAAKRGRKAKDDSTPASSQNADAATLPEKIHESEAA